MFIKSDDKSIRFYYYTAFYHHFLPLDDRDTANDYCDHWITVQGCPTEPGDSHYLGPDCNETNRYKSNSLTL